MTDYPPTSGHLDPGFLPYAPPGFQPGAFDYGNPTPDEDFEVGDIVATRHRAREQGRPGGFTRLEPTDG